MADLANIVPVGFSVETAPLEKGTAALGDFNKAQKEVAKGATELTRAQQEQEAAQRSYESIARRTGESLETIRSRVEAASTAANAHVSAVKAAAAAQAEFNAATTASSGVFSGLAQSLFGYGGAHKSAAAEVEKHAVAHGHANEAVKLFRESVHSLHPVLQTAGVGMGELSGFVMAARGGAVALAAALAGTLVVELGKTYEETERLRKEFDLAFGRDGPEMLHQTEAAARSLRMTLGELAPSVESAYGTLRKAELQRTDELKAAAKAMADQMGIVFAPGVGGEQAQKSFLSAFGPDTLKQIDPAFAKSLQQLQTVFEQTGDSAATAQAKAKDFLRTLPEGAKQDEEAAQRAATSLARLFEVSGTGAAKASEESAKFFDTIKKGGVTEQTYDQLIEKNRLAAQEIAEAFGFKGTDAVYKFSDALRLAGGLPAADLIRALSDINEQVQHMDVPDSVNKSWDNVRLSWHNLIEEFSSGSLSDATQGALNEVSKDIDGIREAIKGVAEAFTDAKNSKVAQSFFSEIQTDAGGAVEAVKGLKEAFVDVWDWLQRHNKAAEEFQNGLAGRLSGANAETAAGIGVPGEFPNAGGMGVGGDTRGRGVNLEDRASELPNAGGDWRESGWQGGTGNEPIGPEGAATEGFNQLSKSLDDASQSTTTAANAASQLDASLGATAASSDAATKNITSFSDVLDQSAKGWQEVGTMAQGAFAGVEDAISSFISYLQSAASQVPSGGGNGIQADVSGPAQDVADITDNAVGGIYTIGGGGTAASQKGPSSSTDSIKLRGNVSPGEVVAVIPADRANQVTMAQLQAIINQSPISIGGGSVSGASSSSINASLLEAVLAGGTGGALPPTLTDPSIRELLAQIAALAAAAKTGTGTGAAAASAAANALSTMGGATGSGGSVSFKDPKQEPQQREQPAPRSSGGGGGGGGYSRPAATTRPVYAPGFVPTKMPHDPGMPDSGPGSPFDPYGPFQPQSPYGPDFGPDYGPYGPIDDPGSPWDPYGPFQDQPYGSDYGPDYGPLPGEDYAPDPYFDPGDQNYPSDEADYVDIGENATGGIYTIGGPGRTRKGYSGISGSDTLGLKGKVSPGEVVAVIPASAATDDALRQVQKLIDNSSINLGGKLPQSLGLTDDQVKAALAQVAALLAKSGAGATTKVGPPSNVLGGATGSGGSVSFKDPKQEPQQREQPAPRGGASEAPRGTARSPPAPYRVDAPRTGSNSTLTNPYAPGQAFDPYGPFPQQPPYGPEYGPDYGPFPGYGPDFGPGSPWDPYGPFQDQPYGPDYGPDYGPLGGEPNVPDYGPDYGSLPDYPSDPYSDPGDQNYPNQNDGSDYNGDYAGDTDFYGGDYATGGVIRGPGTTTSDSIPINASDGEFIVTADGNNLRDAVRYFGSKRGYADGGPVYSQNPFSGTMTTLWGPDPVYSGQQPGAPGTYDAPSMSTRASPSTSTVLGNDNWDIFRGPVTMPLSADSADTSGSGRGGAGLSPPSTARGTVTVNVFGASNPQAFLQSRLSISRAVSLLGK